MALSDGVLVAPIFGHVEIRSWLVIENGKMVGMGGSTTYDRDGKFVSYMESPTGVVLSYV